MQSAQFELHAEIEQRHWWFVARRQILTAVVNAVLPQSRDTTIIDVGCGTGANLAALADQYQCVGIDASAQAIRLASHRFPQVRFVQGLAPRDLAGTFERARLILLTDVLEHVADDFSLLSELLAATHGDTYFLITVPADLKLWSQHDQSFGHYRRYDLDRFRAIWQGLAVSELFASHFNSRLYPIVKSVRAWNRWRGQSAGAAGTDFQLPSPWVNRLLGSCFAGERRQLVRLARGQSLRTYPRGVSLMALLKRTAGTIEPRSKPASLNADFHDPAAQLAAAAV